MSDNKVILNIDDLLNEYQRMESEINEIDSLYLSSKDLLENSTRGSRANLVFVSNQTSNLISIKNHKLNLLKTMNDIKKSIIDLKIKEYNLTDSFQFIRSLAPVLNVQVVEPLNSPNYF